MNFEDLEFNPHPVGNGLQARVFFDNGYGASVVRFMIGAVGGSYGSESGLWELAVLRGNSERSFLCYETPITDDVLGHLSEAEVSRLLGEIEALPEADQ